ncbi:MAG: hypothetical protein ABI207_01845 [Crocinitomicaceae bacterium]
MNKLIKRLIILLVFLSNNLSYAQVDTVAIFKRIDSLSHDIVMQEYWRNLTDLPIDTASIVREINNLTSDSLIDAYWIKLDSCDQDLHTFFKPIEQTKNLLKCYYFFKKFGFSNTKRFSQNNEPSWNPEMYSLIIWQHNCFVDLKYYSSSLVYECNLIYKNSTKDYSEYITRVLTLSPIYNDSIAESKALENCGGKSFKEIDVAKLVELANEYKELIIEMVDNQNVIGTWKIKKSWFILFKSKNDSYYLEYTQNKKTNHPYGSSFYKLDKINSSIFHFTTDISGAYLEILVNGNLAIKDTGGRIIETYLKFTK